MDLPFHQSVCSMFSAVLYLSFLGSLSHWHSICHLSPFSPPISVLQPPSLLLCGCMRFKLLILLPKRFPPSSRSASLILLLFVSLAELQCYDWQVKMPYAAYSGEQKWLWYLEETKQPLAFCYSILRFHHVPNHWRNEYYLTHKSSFLLL